LQVNDNSGAKVIDLSSVACPMRYVLYHATWCPFCRAFASKFREMLPDGEEVLLDNESDPRWITLNIPFVPTVIAFEGDEEVKRVQAKAGIGITDEMFRDFLDRKKVV
jgi:hypothetical protein